MQTSNYCLAVGKSASIEIWVKLYAQISIAQNHSTRTHVVRYFLAEKQQQLIIYNFVDDVSIMLAHKIKHFKSNL